MDDRPPTVAQRLLVPLVYMAVSAAAWWAMTAAGGWAADPIRWGDLSEWFEGVSRDDVLIEAARWLAIAAAVYVFVISVMALLAELAGALRLVSVARVLRLVGSIAAVPALRTRLWHSAATVAVTTASMTAPGGGLVDAAGPAPVEQTVDVPSAGAPLQLPDGTTTGFHGFEVIDHVVGRNSGAVGSSSAGPAWVTVQRGDTLWGLVAEHYGSVDRRMVAAVATANALDDPALIFAGQQLVMPVLGDLQAPVVIPTTGATWSAHRVVAGDTLWEIVEERYGRASAELVWLVAEENALEDPSTIHPGQLLTLPALGDNAAVDDPGVGPEPRVDDIPPDAPPAPEQPTRTTVPEPAPASTPVTVPSATTGVAEIPDNASVPTTTAFAPTGTAATDPTSTVATTPPDPRTTSTADLGDVAVDASDGDGLASPGVSVPMLAGVSGAVVLASSLTVQIGRLRRRRRTRGADTPAPASVATDAVAAAADVPLVRWAGQELARLVEGLNRHRVTSQPVAVELSEDGGLELLWDAAQHVPAPDRWRAADGGWAWRLSYDPEAIVPADERPAAIPALVTIGQRAGRQLMIDLEAFGTVTVTGPGELATSFARALAVELAAGDDLADSDVTIVSEHEIDWLDQHLARLSRVEPERTVARAASAHRSIREALDGVKLDSTFRARVGNPTPLETTVFIATDLDPNVRERLSDLAAPRSGVTAVLITDSPPRDGAHVHIESPQCARLEPLGITFTPVALPQSSVVELDEALTALRTLPDPDTDVSEHPQLESASLSETPTSSMEPLVPVSAAAARAAELLLDASDTDSPVEEPELLVRVLGVPTVPQRPGLGRRELILTVLVACRGGTLAATAAQDAIWGGRPVEAKTVWNVIASARRALGEFADGSAVMPSTDRSRATLRLDPRVGTDLGVLASRVAAARVAPSSDALALLRSGLALVEGPPFDAAGFDWAHRDQDVAEASSLIEQAVGLLVELALESGELDVARDATARGLRGLPGDEPIYRIRMRVEAHAGNAAGIVAAYDELTTYLADLEAEPSPVTTALLHELTRRSGPVR